MHDPNTTLNAVESLIGQLRQVQSSDSQVIERTLIDIAQLVAQPQSMAGAPSDPERVAPSHKRNMDKLANENTALLSRLAKQTSAVKTLKKSVKTLQQKLQSQLEATERIQIREREQRVLTDALRDTIATMSSTLDLNKVLDQILDTVGRVTPYDAANVLFIESDLVHVVCQRGYAEKSKDQAWLKQRIPITKLLSIQQLIDIGKPLAITDTSVSPLWVGFPGGQWVQSNVVAPIRLKDKILGFLSLDSATPGFFTQEHADRLQTFADQAAIAIHNARLYDRAKRAAILAERNRLANELHDTISQTLWSISLISERLPAIWAVNPQEGERSLLTLQHLAQGALAEMRSLLLELRPSELINANLGELIRQLAEITKGRSGLTFTVTIEAQEILPPNIQVVLYRVIQESINNIVLHAVATHVEITYSSQDGQVAISIQDNGRGFDVDQIPLGHLGLSIMQNRIQGIGGTLETNSQIGYGTLTKINWTARQPQVVVR